MDNSNNLGGVVPALILLVEVSNVDRAGWRLK